MKHLVPVLMLLCLSGCRCGVGARTQGACEGAAVVGTFKYRDLAWDVDIVLAMQDDGGFSHVKSYYHIQSRDSGTWTLEAGRVHLRFLRVDGRRIDGPPIVLTAKVAREGLYLQREGASTLLYARIDNGPEGRDR